jgi:hypothetical protein
MANGEKGICSGGMCVFTSVNIYESAIYGVGGLQNDCNNVVHCSGGVRAKGMQCTPSTKDEVLRRLSM